MDRKTAGWVYTQRDSRMERDSYAPRAPPPPRRARTRAQPRADARAQQPNAQPMNHERARAQRSSTPAVSQAHQLDIEVGRTQRQSGGAQYRHTKHLRRDPRQPHQHELERAGDPAGTDRARQLLDLVSW